MSQNNQACTQCWHDSKSRTGNGVNHWQTQRGARDPPLVAVSQKYYALVPTKELQPFMAEKEL